MIEHPVYLLIGSGRVSRHFACYLKLLGIRFLTWSREADETGTLADRAAPASHVLCLISDPAINGFLSEHSSVFQGKTLVHASGALVSPLAESAHPLMSFGPRLYDLDTYCSIPFILEKGRKSFSEVLPGLTNAHYEIPSEDKVLYHALCALSGNFTVMLWQRAMAQLEDRLSLPRQVMLPYLKQVAMNLEREPHSALTGPVARGDQGTIAQHLIALEGDPYAAVYRAFVEAAKASG